MKFSKMHGLGNDFMIVNSINQNIIFSTTLIAQLANRHTGIGFDQLLIIEQTLNPNIDFQYRIFNADGSEALQCGNGIRCFTRFVYLNKLTDKQQIKASTRYGYTIISNINKNNDICVNMGEPNFEPKMIPFLAVKKKKKYLIQLKKQTITCGVVSIGNPHCIIQVKNISTTEIKILGKELEKHKCFPEYTNIGFMEIINIHHIRLRVYERGVGETQACGTGACAAVAVGITQGLLNNIIRVDLPGGTLEIKWNGVGTPLYMIGPATHVYDGIVNI
ncbi:Diaminopimelate epimerase [Candidatus Providencia siddallii]|uniref:Diaminopimelate epimerase n=1 Tax=Candidatus Providencia siddallii TaxID=1715285 RepID=A0A0M6W7V0_9GAMM|nr:Diaminopimelate epimerase [Candidatus Providencia siddallii]